MHKKIITCIIGLIYANIAYSEDTVIKNPLSDSGTNGVVITADVAKSANNQSNNGPSNNSKDVAVNKHSEEDAAIKSLETAENCLKDSVCKTMVESKITYNKDSGLPPPSALPQQNLREIFNSTMGGVSPEQIKEIHKYLDEHQRAIAELPSTPPKPVTTSVSVSLSPGSTPPVIRLFPGYATSITVTDSTGAIWPVENWSMGNKKMFDIKRLDDVAAFSVVPLGTYAQSNMVISLKGNPTPISVTFVTGQKEVDYRVDLRVQAVGPNAQLAVSGLPANVNNELLSVLDGVVPQGSKNLKVEKDSLLSAWISPAGKYFIRTKHSVISPAFLSTVKSSDGTSVYEVMPTSVLLLMVDGKITQTKIFE